MDRKSKVLQDIGTYKFLTCSQLLKLNPDVSRKSMYSILSMLRSAKLRFIDHQTYGYHPQYWKLEDIHFLLPRGKTYLLKHTKLTTNNIKSSKHKTKFYDDYYHRLAVVDIHIAVRELCESQKVNLCFFDAYFERGGHYAKNQKETSTKLHYNWSYVIPDAIFQRNDHGTTPLFCLEMHNGQRVKKICDQAIVYTDILKQGTVAHKYHVTHPTVVLLVFEHLSTLRTSLERLQALRRFDRMRDYFWFNTLYNIKTKPDTFRVSLEWKKVFLSDLRT